MKKVACLLLALCLILPLCACATQDVQEPTSPTEESKVPDVTQEPASPTEESKVPDVTQEPTSPTEGTKVSDVTQKSPQNQSMQWSPVMWADVTSSDMMEEASGDSPAVYAKPDSSVEAEVTMVNGLNAAQPYHLLLLVDGVPTPFTVDGQTYDSYPLELTSERIKLPITFLPEFSLKLGRVDVLLCFDGDTTGDFPLTSHTMLFDLPETAQAPAQLLSTVPQRELLVGSYSGEAYGAWFWKEGVALAEEDITGPRVSSIAAGEQILFEAIAAKAGLYRTVFLVNGQAVQVRVNGEVRDFLDWESGGTDMLQVPLELVEGCDVDGSFFTVATPIDSDNRTPCVSWKIQLNAASEGE